VSLWKNHSSYFLSEKTIPKSIRSSSWENQRLRKSVSSWRRKPANQPSLAPWSNTRTFCYSEVSWEFLQRFSVLNFLSSDFYISFPVCYITTFIYKRKFYFKLTLTDWLKNRISAKQKNITLISLNAGFESFPAVCFWLEGTFFDFCLKFFLFQELHFVFLIL
jgi:hypothetical protein